MYMLHMDKLTPEALSSLKPSFENVPETDHKDGKYRLRRYSTIQLLAEPRAFKHLEGQQFTQSSDYNNFQGDVPRTFENVEEDTLGSKGMEEMMYLFRTLNQLPHGTAVDIHQMRVITLHDGTPVSPEGAHQDGYECIAMFGIARENIEGGDLLVTNSKEGDPFITLPLDEGTGVFLNDQALWHNATPLTAIEKEHSSYMDVFILTANK